MGKPQSTHGRENNAFNILVGETEWKRPRGRPRHRWEDVRIELREIRWKFMDWTHFLFIHMFHLVKESLYFPFLASLLLKYVDCTASNEHRLGKIGPEYLKERYKTTSGIFPLQHESKISAAHLLRSLHALPENGCHRHGSSTFCH